MKLSDLAILTSLILACSASSSSSDYYSSDFDRRLASMSTYEPDEGVDESFYSGRKADGAPVSDHEDEWKSFDDEDDSFPNIPEHLINRVPNSPIDHLRKPLNEDSIRSSNAKLGHIDAETWDAISTDFLRAVSLKDVSGNEDSDSWSEDETNLTEDPSFYSGINSDGTVVGDTEDSALTYDPSFEGLEKDSESRFKSTA